MNPDSDGDFMATHERKGLNSVKFYWREVPNKKKTQEAGRPVADWKEYVIILCPGQPRSATDRPANEIDKRQYPREYEAFQKNEEAPLPGTPINQLPGMSPYRAQELRRIHIFTVEQMAACSETARKDVGMDFNTLKASAAEFLKRGTPEVEALKAQVAELTAQLAQLTAKKKPSRPPRAAQPEQAAA